MSKIEKLSIALTAEMAAIVRQAVESGDYASSSEVVCDALRDWKAKQNQARNQVEHLRRLAAEGLASGSAPWRGIEGTMAEVHDRSRYRAKA